jgi:hypothetical protein
MGCPDDTIQMDRINALDKLGPSNLWTGMDGWNGYVVLAFQWSRAVVLEKPFYGNALYLITGDWENMVGFSKRYLLEHYSENCSRIYHCSNWLNKVRSELKKRGPLNLRTPDSRS